MRHSAKVVDFSGLDIGDDGDQVCRITEISVVEEDLDTSFMTVSVNVVNSTCIEARRAANNSVDLNQSEMG